MSEPMNVFAIERCKKGLMKALNNVAREGVAFVLDCLDFVCSIPDGAIWRQHFFKEYRAVANLLRDGDEIIEESLVTRDPLERHSTSRMGS